MSVMLIAYNSMGIFKLTHFQIFKLKLISPPPLSHDE